MAGGTTRIYGFAVSRALTQASMNANGFGDLTTPFAGIPRLFPRRPHAHISLGHSPDMDRLQVQRDEEEESAADQPWLAARLPAAATPGAIGLRPRLL